MTYKFINNDQGWKKIMIFLKIKKITFFDLNRIFWI